MPPKTPNPSAPPHRRALLARADVRLFQCQVKDTKGRIRNVLVWQCGPDIFYSGTMEGLFDPQRRRKADQWLIEQIIEPPAYTALLTHRTGERYAKGGTAVFRDAGEIRSVAAPEGSDVNLDEDGIQAG